MRAFLTAQAQRDITAVKAYVAKDNLSASERVAAKLYDEISRLEKSPNLGLALSGKFNIETDLRMLIVSPNLILYKIIEDKIIVTRVIDGRRDYLSVLGLSKNDF